MDSATTAARAGSACAPASTVIDSQRNPLEVISEVATEYAQRRLGVDDAMTALRQRHKITAHRPYVRELLFKEWFRLWGDT